MLKENICSCEDCESRWPNFNALTKEELDFVSLSRFEASFKPGEVILKQGSPASNAVFLLYGLAKVYMEGQGERNFILNIARPGKMIIGPGIYTDSRHIFTASALNDVRACFIDSNVIRKLVKQNSDFAEGMLRDVSYKAENNFYKLMSMTQKKMPGRVAEVLLYLSENIFESDEFTLLLTRQELADMSGMAKESVVRILKEFSNEKIIDSGSSEFRILNKERLKMISING
ncbi:MAG TPA: Crp/Fnr family transcriptional regulator [Bacteroidales bacterium]|nr:Crp/Fnr family transcriptional regulator [Bacteroidales bacterium]